MIRCYKLVIIAFILFLASCVNEQKRDALDYSLKLSRSNRSELETVLDHYPEGSDKRMAAEFLISNMIYHESYSGESIDNYRNLIMSVREEAGPVEYDQIDSLWLHANPDRVRLGLKRDILNVTSDFLITHIDTAFDIWEGAPWRDSISLDVFTNYILPYKVLNEPLNHNWPVLRDRYLPLVEGVGDPHVAYETVHRRLIKDFTVSQTPVPYNYCDPLIMDGKMRGDCNQRSVYIINVMRSLGIPTAYEFFPRIANYSSDAPHSWVTYIKSDREVYSMGDNDTISSRNPRARLLKWKTKNTIDEYLTLFKIDSMKKAPKVSRKTYAINYRDDFYDNFDLPDDFVNPNDIDVSSVYDINNSIKIKAGQKKQDNAYLCTFTTGKGWSPFAVTMQNGRTVRFKDINNDICYLPIYIEDGKHIPITNPIILNKDNSMRVMDPAEETETVILRRKYILISPSIDEWSNGCGATIQVSDNRDFSDVDTLHQVVDIPIGPTNVEVSPERAYRYVRFHVSNRRFRQAELAFYGVDTAGKEVKLEGDMIAYDIIEEYARNVFDMDYMTHTAPVRGQHNPSRFAIGLDLGEGDKMKLSRVQFTPSSSTNFIEPPHKYELFYYDMGWHSLGKKVAEREYLVYDNVPKNAVLWLRDKTKGKEERIFTYENDKQVWW